MGRYRSRSRSYSPRRSKRYDDPRDSRRSRRDRRSPAPSGLLVRNISLDARPEDLRISFERFGPIKDIYLPKDYYTGEPRGFGFVKYLHPEDAADAKERLNHTVIGGHDIQIVFAEENRKTPQEMRRMSRISERGSYRSRSPARSPRHRYHSYSRSPSPSRSGTRFLSEKETLKEFRLIKTETKFIKSRLLAYIFDKASTELKKEYRACSWPKKESTSKIGTDRGIMGC